MAELKDFPAITVPLPELDIYRRLGYNRHLTQLPQKQREIIDKNIDEALSLCRARGRYLIDGISANDGGVITSAGGLRFESAALCKLLEGCRQIVVMGATVGAEVVALVRKKIEREEGAAALICDAAASETTDAILDWLQKYLAATLTKTGAALTSQRFSAGYGDLRLENQAQIFQALRLQELGVAMLPSFILEPEKSVTAIAGIYMVD